MHGCGIQKEETVYKKKYICYYIKMGFVEGFAEYTLSNEEGEMVTQEEINTFQMKFFILVVVIKLAMIYIVNAFLWPKVVPKIFSGVKANPGFMNLLGLVVVYYLLF